MVYQTSQAKLKDEKTITKETLKVLRQNTVAQAEAQRRGIQGSPEEAKNFTASQRAMVEQSPKDSPAYKAYEADMKVLGFNDPDKYWSYHEQLYTEGLRIAKLREQVGQAAGAKSYDEVEKNL
ncbi:MAG TPA: hypothetical protein VH186_30915 [Chloroflexia bacterium]|nr:hypothetical protein [Chloroflexia bacterium]